MRSHEKTFVEWVVAFDNGATHHCKSYDEAMQFAVNMDGVGTYGKPTTITKVTKYVTTTYDDVCEFGEDNI